MVATPTPPSRPVSTSHVKVTGVSGDDDVEVEVDVEVDVKVEVGDDVVDEVVLDVVEVVLDVGPDGADVPSDSVEPPLHAAMTAKAVSVATT
jgi:hypothetical protein